MKASRLIKQLKLDEGYRLKLYKDSLGYKTIGIGHLIKESDPEWLKKLDVGDKITEEQAMKIFEEDLAIALSDTKIIFEPVWESLPCSVQESLVNMCFNLGRTRLMKFKKTIAHIYNHDYHAASIEMLDSDWADQVGSRAYRLSSVINMALC